MAGLRSRLRDARYALPGAIERRFRGPDPAAVARLCRGVHAKGFAATIGYFQAEQSPPDEIVGAYVAVAARLARLAGDSYLSVKAPPLGFDTARLHAIADAAGAAGLALLFDAHAPADADRTLDAAAGLIAAYPRTGIALPARWRRSLDDAARFRDSGARIRIVKGEWADPECPEADIDAAFLRLVSSLAGRAGPVAVATHDPALAEAALAILLRSGTPCELEQLRGLPRRGTTAVARRRGVPIRLYLPFGPGWWPYAVDQALARPYLLSWMIRDLRAA
jgi:proline dehydrogenase